MSKNGFAAALLIAALAPTLRAQTDDPGGALASGFESVEMPAAEVRLLRIAALDETSPSPQTPPPPPPAETAPSLRDLGFTLEQAQGSAEAHARLDKRTKMLKIHQRLGLITLVPLIATLATAGGAKAHSGGESNRNLHGALGLVTAALYVTAASYAIRAPKIEGTETRGAIRWHKALAWVHGAGMILTPILGAMARAQLNRGERVHGIASAHSAVAGVTVAAYAVAIGTVAVKF